MASADVLAGVPGAAEAAAALRGYLEWEAAFDGWPMIRWIQANWKLPLVCCGLYLVMVFLGPVLMRGAEPGTAAGLRLEAACVLLPLLVGEWERTRPWLAVLRGRGGPKRG